jgi:DNA polymerase
VIWLDLETYSPTPIKHGVHAYAEKAEILLFPYALDDGPVQVWDCTQVDEPPADLVAALRDPTELVTAHNAAFDRTLLRHVLPDLCPPLERWRCSMVLALEHSLPAGLGQLCQVLRVPTDLAKNSAGKKLIRLFCQPRPRNVKIRRASADTHPIEWSRFVDYARSDIVAMRECVRRIPNWNFKGNEVALWHLDQTINDRGVQVDLELARAALRATDREQARLADLTQELTSGAVGAATQRDALLAHIRRDFGIALPDLQKATVEKLLGSGELPVGVFELLSVRLASSTTSTAKYQKIIDCTSRDGRLRGLLQFCGASRTGRWAGRGPQFHNLPRGGIHGKELAHGIEAMLGDCEDLLIDNVMELCSSAVRGTIVAPPGKKLVICDLANVEGRGAAWLAGEAWKLDAFRDYDTILGFDDRGEPIRKGHDLYVLAYAKSFSTDPEYVTKDQRMIGKIQELALQYGGGANAFATFARAYGIDMDDMAIKAKAVLPPDTWDAASGLLAFMKKQGNDSDLSDLAWTACDAFKRLWREAHPGITGYWAQLDNALINAMAGPGTQFDAGFCKIQFTANWLRVRLPSGRYLVYPDIRLNEEAGRVSYAGVHQFTRKWERIDTYGPKVFENLTQAISRDLLAHGLQLAEQRGYRPVLSIHDELICEVPDSDEFNVAGLAECMAAVPAWATDLPLAAAGFETQRYKKG